MLIQNIRHGHEILGVARRPWTLDGNAGSFAHPLSHPADASGPSQGISARAGSASNGSRATASHFAHRTLIHRTPPPVNLLAESEAMVPSYEHRMMAEVGRDDRLEREWKRRSKQKYKQESSQESSQDSTQSSSCIFPMSLDSERDAAARQSTTASSEAPKTKGGGSASQPRPPGAAEAALADQPPSDRPSVGNRGDENEATRHCASSHTPSPARAAVHTSEARPQWGRRQSSLDVTTRRYSSRSGSFTEGSIANQFTTEELMFDLPDDFQADIAGDREGGQDSSEAHGVGQAWASATNTLFEANEGEENPEWEDVASQPDWQAGEMSRQSGAGDGLRSRTGSARDTTTSAVRRPMPTQRRGRGRPRRPTLRKAPAYGIAVRPVTTRPTVRIEARNQPDAGQARAGQARARLAHHFHTDAAAAAEGPPGATASPGVRAGDPPQRRQPGGVPLEMKEARRAQRPGRGTRRTHPVDVEARGNICVGARGVPGSAPTIFSISHGGMLVDSGYRSWG